MDKCMNMHLLKKTNSTSQRSRVDRFVAPRESLEELRWRPPVPADCNPAPLIWSAKYVKQKNYASHIDKAYGFKSSAPAQRNQTWPCIPRTRAHLSSTNIVLDLPTYSAWVFPDLLDWSKDDILVAALDNKYYKWSWRTQKPIGEGFTLFSSACCRFDPTGERLAIGTDMQRVEVHNPWSKVLAASFCRSVDPKQLYCIITAIEWSPTGNSFVTGCSQGTLSCFDRDAKLICHRQAASSAILLLRVSPDARYVAAVEFKRSEVLVMMWPSLQLYKAITADWVVQSIAWHPWRSSLLGIGCTAASEQLKSWIELWDAPRQTIRTATTVSKSDYTLDTMLFSHLTGELVLSLWNTDEQLGNLQKQSSQLVVMSGRDTVVDQWGEGRFGMERVRSMIFSPDGTKLATATEDEDLIIWHFMRQGKKPHKKTTQNKFSAMPSYIDQSMYGFSLR